MNANIVDGRSSALAPAEHIRCITYLSGQTFHFSLDFRNLDAIPNAMQQNLQTPIQQSKTFLLYRRRSCKVPRVLALLALGKRGKSRAWDGVAAEGLEEVELDTGIGRGVEARGWYAAGQLCGSGS